MCRTVGCTGAFYGAVALGDHRHRLQVQERRCSLQMTGFDVQKTVPACAACSATKGSWQDDAVRRRSCMHQIAGFARDTISKR